MTPASAPPRQGWGSEHCGSLLQSAQAAGRGAERIRNSSPTRGLSRKRTTLNRSTYPRRTKAFLPRRLPPRTHRPNHHAHPDERTGEAVVRGSKRRASLQQAHSECVVRAKMNTAMASAKPSPPWALSRSISPKPSPRTAGASTAPVRSKTCGHVSVRPLARGGGIPPISVAAAQGGAAVHNLPSRPFHAFSIVCPLRPLEISSKRASL
jgi:hypothetical protein